MFIYYIRIIITNFAAGLRKYATYFSTYIGPCKCKSEDNRETLRKAVQKILNLKYGKLFNSSICITIYSTFHMWQNI